MEEKLRRLMRHEGINSTRLAEILGIQASGISHIMSGRNKPSYDFLLKLLQRFPQINPDWLLLDKGPMYRDEIKKSAVAPIPVAPEPEPSQTPTFANELFSPPPVTNPMNVTSSVPKSYEPDNDDIIPAPQRPSESKTASGHAVERVLVFYRDRTFAEYRPE